MKRRSSARVEATHKAAVPAAEELVRAAADRIGPLIHNAADYVGPLVHSAADHIGPLAHSAASKVGPLAHSAADAVVPLAQSAADRFNVATEFVSPYWVLASERVSPLAHQAVDRVAPLAHQAVDFVSPYAQQAALVAVPLAAGAREGGTRARAAAVALTPILVDAAGRVPPAVGAAKGRVTDEVLPKLSHAVSAAAATPVMVEATRRSKATLAAARGELYLPEPVTQSKGGLLKRLLLITLLAGVAGAVLRKLLSSKDAGWQSARPTTPYAPPSPAPAFAEPSTSGGVEDVPASQSPAAGEVAGIVAMDATETTIDTSPIDTSSIDGDPMDRAPMDSGALGAPTSFDDGLDDEGVPAEIDTDPGTDALASIADIAPVESLDDPLAGDNDPEPSSANQNDAVGAGEWGDSTTPTLDDGLGVELGEPPADLDDDALSTSSVEPTEVESRYSGEGVHEGSEPPEGFFIKGNERSMKYHTPESGGYAETHAEVWFNSEEAAQRAGFVRAQG